MEVNNYRGRRSSLVLFLPVLFIVFLLEITSLPEVVQDYRPDLLSLTLLFFAISEPRKYSIEVAWICGLILDLLTGSPLGVHAMVLALQIYIIISQFKYFAQYALWQQALIIGLVHLIADVIIFWLEHIIGQSNYESTFIVPALTTALFWFPVFLGFGLMYRFFSIGGSTDNK